MQRIGQRKRSACLDAFCKMTVNPGVADATFRSDAGTDLAGILDCVSADCGSTRTRARVAMSQHSFGRGMDVVHGLVNT